MPSTGLASMSATGLALVSTTGSVLVPEVVVGGTSCPSNYRSRSGSRFGRHLLSGISASVIASSVSANAANWLEVLIAAVGVTTDGFPFIRQVGCVLICVIMLKNKTHKLDDELNLIITQIMSATIDSCHSI